jgi:hypothetical protein
VRKRHSAPSFSSRDEATEETAGHDNGIGKSKFGAASTGENERSESDAGSGKTAVEERKELAQRVGKGVREELKGVGVAQKLAELRLTAGLEGERELLQTGDSRNQTNGRRTAMGNVRATGVATRQSRGVGRVGA